MIASNNFSQLCFQFAILSFVISCAFSASIPIHKHRRHLPRRLYLNSYGSSMTSRSTNEIPSMEGSLIEHKARRDSTIVRNKPLSINLLNSGFMMRPDKTSQLRGNTRLYRINPLASRQEGIRSLKFGDMSSTMKQILLRMN